MEPPPFPFIPEKRFPMFPKGFCATVIHETSSNICMIDNRFFMVANIQTKYEI
jgi:hypothetical protein